MWKIFTLWWNIVPGGTSDRPSNSDLHYATRNCSSNSQLATPDQKRKKNSTTFKETLKSSSNNKYLKIIFYLFLLLLNSLHKATSSQSL